jgi:hypothetical protein
LFPTIQTLNLNFPYPLVILRHWRDLETQQERKKAFAQGLNCLARKNAKIPEVVKVKGLGFSHGL